MIKEIDKKYLEELVELKKSAWKKLEKKLGKTPDNEIKKYLNLTLKKGKLFGYFSKNKLVGCIGIVINKKEKYGEIENFFVKEEFQGKGIGKELIKFIENYARMNKINFLKLNVRLKNTKAINFYKKRGYEKFALIMGKKIKFN